MAFARDGVPDEEIQIQALIFKHVDEDATVAAVEGARAVAVGAWVGEVGHRRGRGEAGSRVPLADLEPVEEAEEWRCSVERAVAAEEARVAQDAEPWLADEGGAEEVLGLVRREAEEDLADKLVHQLRWWSWRRWRRHGARGGGCEGFGLGLGREEAKRERVGDNQSHFYSVRFNQVTTVNGA
jgi:hypothetical protein